MKVLVVGSGGREHALCWKIKQSPIVNELYCAPGNAGIESEATCVEISVTDYDSLLKFVKDKNIDLTVVGPEVPLSEGIVDIFEKEGHKIFGPSKLAAEIEGSKVFAKNLMNKYGIPTAAYETFTNVESALNYINNVEFPVVIKADGLAAGKGVIICQTKDEAINAIKSIMSDKKFGDAGNELVVEEFLDGEEASFFVFTDGENFIPLESSQDHKAIFEGDKGPNTGGMGAYSPAPVVSGLNNKILDEIVVPTINAMKLESRIYRGILYVGLMIRDTDIKVVEFNCRFGDPEAQPLLFRMISDIVPILIQIANKELTETKIEWKDGSSLCVVMSSKGYPGRYDKGL